MANKIDWKWWKKQVVKGYVPQNVYARALMRSKKKGNKQCFIEQQN